MPRESPCPSPYFRLRRKAARAFDCSPFIPRFGISAPGFMCSGFSIHLVRLSGVLAISEPAKVLRLAEWVRSGPMWPAEVPGMVWQPTHLDLLDRGLSFRARASGGCIPGARFALNH